MQKNTKITGTDGGWLTGQMLIAMPAMRDPRFVQSVIFLCAHSPEGAMGVVLNRPARGPKFPALLQRLGVQPSPPLREVGMSAGGPVEESRGFVLHSPDWHGEASLDVDETYVLTGSLEILTALAEGGGPEKARLMLGYAGWGAGQLESEIRENVWLIAPPDDSLVYDGLYTTKWQRALAKLKIEPGMLSGEVGRA